MKSRNLGRLEPADLRSVWKTEAGGFTPSLAEEKNLALLGDAIGLDGKAGTKRKPYLPTVAR